MATKVERLLFTRKRLIQALTEQELIITKFNDKTDTTELLNRKELLEELWADLRANINAIESAANWVGTDEYLQEDTIVREGYCKARGILTRLIPSTGADSVQHSLTMFQTVRGAQIDENAFEDGADTRHTSTPAAPTLTRLGLAANIKLPTLTIKPFSGKLTDWPEFKALCESTFTPIMDESHRFKYLRSHLTDEPARLIKYIPIAHGSYDRAWSILKNRYDNERAIINANLANLINLQKPVNESVDALKKMRDTSNECIEAIRSFEINTDSWDAILIFLMIQRLDPLSVRYWEESIQGSHTVPKWAKFVEFLDVRIQVLETTANSVTYTSKLPAISQKARVCVALTDKKCVVCDMPNHYAFKCNHLISVAYEQRLRIVNDKGLCTNCLFKHNVENCKSKFSCRICAQRHHTLLHPPERIHNITTGDTEPELILDPEELQVLEMEEYMERHEIIAHVNDCSEVKLATAMVRIEFGNQHMLIRTLIDPGATASLISQRVCEAFGLPMAKITMPIMSVCDSISFNVKKKTMITIKPGQLNSGYALQLPALVVPRIATVNSSTIKQEWRHLDGLELADPEWETGGRVDLLLGSAVHAEILLNGLVKGLSGQPIAQKTELGWIVSGGNGGQKQITSVFTIKVSNEDLSGELQRFWEDEEIATKKIFTPDEQRAEDFYVNTTKRCDDGRFMVKLPFINESPSFGASKGIAKRRYEGMNKRLSKTPELKTVYDQGIQEYLDLGQMELTDDEIWPHYYLPHHPVIKESSTTTKVRTVYDASCKTSNGNSLNSQLLVGPTIQADLFSILLHWRKGKYAITGDIEKMYRQIWLDPEHTEFQRILWQPPGTTELKTYRLKTVTFGVASSPFLAIRTLFLIADDVEANNPEMADKIRYQFYVDDYFDSVETIEDAKNMIKFMTQTLGKYGFLLRKWKSNHEAILNELKIEDIDNSPSNVFKTLGVQWLPNTDEFLFVPAEFKGAEKWTKRSILSDIAKLFDPLGWLSPCVIVAKMFMQTLWLLKIGWDEKIPDHIETEWLNIRQQFATMCSVKVPRWIGLEAESSHISLQGFCDASERAMASVVYIRIQSNSRDVSCKLIAAKTKVAPLRKISIPKLELNAAVLLSKLMLKVKDGLRLPNIRVHAWSDSEIVLHWLANHPSRWKTYVAGRVSNIQAKIPFETWRHIPSAKNPADCASRGITRTELEKSDLWWQGPSFLLQKEDEWPNKEIKAPSGKILEERAQNIIATIKVITPNTILAGFSSYIKMLRVMTHLFRWRFNRSALRKPINVEDMQATEIWLIKIVQKETYEIEILSLQKGWTVSNKSTIRSLDPFLDDKGVLRVGGRIQRAALSENERHPIILPPKHHFVTLLVRNAHEQALHGGFALTAQKLRHRYWIINNRSVIKSVLHHCTICFRFKKKLLVQKMGNLPAYRVQETLPFTYVGVDYAGYFEIKTSQRKNAPYEKGYVSVFVCLTTRAVHLELVSSLSTEHFLKAFKRFISRRGTPTHMFSDNATNFIGADKEIQNTLDQALGQSDNHLNTLLLEKRIKWSMIPARAPHFGGWESSVKLVKYHMKRVLGNVRLGYEDFDTLICEIEGIVNSRPLWSIPTRPDEYEALTPGHFLISKAINTLPEASLDHVPVNRLSQYQYLQRLRNEFWRLWSKEYIQTLQARKKWRETQPNVRPGQIVLVSEDNESPTCWSLGKVMRVHPGEDGLVRVADIFCRNKTLRRPIHKLSLLPIIDNEEDFIIEQKSSRRGSMVRTEPVKE